MHIHAQTCSESKQRRVNGYSARVGVTFKFSLSSIMILPVGMDVVVWVWVCSFSGDGCFSAVRMGACCCLGIGVVVWEWLFYCL